ncbi:helix-turn-helix domain-containing protein [Yersinia ruckeri]|uniref:transcriptional regulator n=1 Tax=Yersinia ruckeri TaxID=29486 RepID=UPI0020C0C0A4|nr:helix-turn-helix domain-containing protein [Yersinia ruckeri]EKN4773914.1 helix-turn-helix domain-containing protein [Yersinia enterocolitica]ELX2274143.1 helix-turn-helix domain-containing protein [Yersinia enterocolitica]MCK8543803.1 helix-turn-helix domain-containing protein [Yersinia ruckeri]MCK8553382.1 helix-turn-helix domain-containing protein [Yersinia ruckeri]MCW6518895.1 helix-turn-helix domain-containing protein [Yersinia ruckeri]
MNNQIFKSPIDKAVYIAGGQTALAKQIGVTQGAVWKWVRGLKNVSPVHAVAISQAVGGQVKPFELRPDLPTVFPHPTQD